MCVHLETHLQDKYIRPIESERSTVLDMLRPVHLLLLLVVVVLVVAAEDPAGPAPVQPEPPQDGNPNDLEADASYWGYSRPWRYYGGYRGYGGWGGYGYKGWGWGGRGYGYGRGYYGGWW